MENNFKCENNSVDGILVLVLYFSELECFITTDLNYFTP